MRITGQLIDVENYSGSFRGDDGGMIDYSGTRLHVLDGREVVKIKVPKGQPVPDLARGDEVDLRVTVAANSGARGAYLTTSLVGLWAESSALSDVYRAAS